MAAYFFRLVFAFLALDFVAGDALFASLVTAFLVAEGILPAALETVVFVADVIFFIAADLAIRGH